MGGAADGRGRWQWWHWYRWVAPQPMGSRVSRLARSLPVPPVALLQRFRPLPALSLPHMYLLHPLPQWTQTHRKYQVAPILHNWKLYFVAVASRIRKARLALGIATSPSAPLSAPANEPALRAVHGSTPRVHVHSPPLPVSDLGGPERPPLPLVEPPISISGAAHRTDLRQNDELVSRWVGLTSRVWVLGMITWPPGKCRLNRCIH